MTEYQDNK